jgi:hypothetical protein
MYHAKQDSFLINDNPSSTHLYVQRINHISTEKGTLPQRGRSGGDSTVLQDTSVTCTNRFFGFSSMRLHPKKGPSTSPSGHQSRYNSRGECEQRSTPDVKKARSPSNPMSCGIQIFIRRRDVPIQNPSYRGKERKVREEKRPVASIPCRKHTIQYPVAYSVSEDATMGPSIHPLEFR